MNTMKLVALCGVITLGAIQPALANTVTDTDGDGLSDLDETLVYATDPTLKDTDRDGFSDSFEIAHGYSPRVDKSKKLSEIDTDGDGLTDDKELMLGTRLAMTDTDGDGHSDGYEATRGFNPLLGNGDRSLPRHVEVDLDKQQLYYFLNNVKLGSMPVSSGKLATPTPVGEFSIMRKVPVVHYRGPDYDLPNTKWNLEFKKTYYLHGAYWHNQFGKRPMSHGCVNIAYKDADMLYAFMDVGDAVKVYGKTPTKVVKK